MEISTKQKTVAGAVAVAALATVIAVAPGTKQPMPDPQAIATSAVSAMKHQTDVQTRPVEVGAEAVAHVTLRGASLVAPYAEATGQAVGSFVVEGVKVEQHGAALDVYVTVKNTSGATAAFSGLVGYSRSDD